MLFYTARRALSRPAATLTARNVSTKSAFNFLPTNSLSHKPRGKGLTEIRGPYYYPVTATYLDELLSDWGAYVDGVKFAGGAFSLMPEERLKLLIDVAHKHGMLHCIFPTSFAPQELTVCQDCYVSTGGYIERVLAASAGNRQVVSKYLTACKNVGFDVLEISSGFLSIPTECWLNLIEDTKKHGLKPKPEVGIQYVLNLSSRLIPIIPISDGELEEMLLLLNSNRLARATRIG